jgi:DNA invertase Pin-like site-specific DNA recombinase
MSKRVALYARVSTDQQSTDNQVSELRRVAERHGWTVVAEFVDQGVSGAKGRKGRPQFDALLRGVARRQFDMVVAWSVDRLGRSMTDLLGFLQELDAKGVGLYLDKQAVDTSTPAGKALFQMCGVFAEFERSLIVERVNAGLARARAKGTRSGRPFGRPRVDAEKEERVRAMRLEGHGKRRIARAVGVGISVVQRVLTA